MAVELKVPQSGESITEVQIGQWRKAVGDYVEVDEVLVEIETDKAAIELPAPSAGVLSKILKNDGEEAAVGDVIGLMEEGAKPVNGSKAKPEKAETAPEPAPKSKKPAADGQAPRVMPAAKRVLAQAGVDVAAVKGSGPGGRITKEDALNAAEAAEAKPAPAPAARPAPAPQKEAPSAPPEPSSAPGREEEVVSMTPMRKVIARNLVHAQQTAALLTTFNEVDMSAVMALRNEHKNVFEEKYGIKLGFMSFFVKAAVEALKQFPGRQRPHRRRRTSSTATITTSASPSAAAADWSCRSCATPRI